MIDDQDDEIQDDDLNDELSPEIDFIPLAIFLEHRVRAQIWKAPNGAVGVSFDCQSCDCENCEGCYLEIFEPSDLKDLLVVMKRTQKWFVEHIFGELLDEP